jgi:hypothetical protein
MYWNLKFSTLLSKITVQPKKKKKFLQNMFHTLVSSRKLNTQVSFSDRPLSVFGLSIRYILLVENHWANFNQARHKSSWGGFKFVQIKSDNILG